MLLYPFVRQSGPAPSNPATTLSFVITLAPASVEPTAESAVPVPTLPAPIVSMPASDAAPVVVLPGNGAPDDPVPTALATVPPTPATPASPPDRIVIPAIELDAPVEPVGWHVEKVNGVDTSVWDVPHRRAAGWLKTSAPAGQPGNTVLDGHHNIYGEVFKRLIDLQPGDKIDLHANQRVYHYAVTEKHLLLELGQPVEVRLANARWIEATPDERLTLVTCWPYTSNTHRLIIVARPLQSMPTQEE